MKSAMLIIETLTNTLSPHHNVARTCIPCKFYLHIKTLKFCEFYLLFKS